MTVTERLRGKMETRQDELSEGGRRKSAAARVVSIQAWRITTAAQSLISFTTEVGKLQLSLVIIDQTNVDQVSHVARRQVLRLRNTKGDAAKGDFLAQTE